MDPTQARDILRALADGRDPATGAPFPPDSPYQQADTVRALYAALDALEPVIRRARRQQVANQPANQSTDAAPKPPADPNRPKAGQPWSAEEDQQLRDAFAAQTPIAALAAAHGRTRGAITARLVRLGLIEDKNLLYPPLRPSSPAPTSPPPAPPPPAPHTPDIIPEDCPF